MSVQKKLKKFILSLTALLSCVFALPMADAAQIVVAGVTYEITIYDPPAGATILEIVNVLSQQPWWNADGVLARKAALDAAANGQPVSIKNQVNFWPADSTNTEGLLFAFKYDPNGRWRIKSESLTNGAAAPVGNTDKDEDVEYAIVKADVAIVTGSANKFVNVSTRGFAGTGDQVMIVGFVIPAGQAQTVLIRGVGPTLIQFGLAANTVLTDPVIEIYRAGETASFATNDDWSGSQVSAVAARVGAFALGTASRDAAFLINLLPGGYTVQVKGKGNTTGIAMVEVYEVD
jgi:hypothetical protein